MRISDWSSDVCSSDLANDQKMPDAMVTEMRRHLEGAVTTVETGMMFGLRTKAAEVAPMLPDAVDTLGYGYCWRAIELHPGLAGPELVAHMRHRASISIMARQGGGEIGRASGRERGCQYVKLSGVAVSLKKKQ